MSVIDHCPGEKPSADSPGCDEYFCIQCDECGTCWEVGPDADELEFDDHLCAKCEKAEEDDENVVQPGLENKMTEEKMKELLFSLAWYDCSCYHNLNAKAILAQEFPDADFSSSLAQFELCKTMPPGMGCPR